MSDVVVQVDTLPAYLQRGDAQSLSSVAAVLVRTLSRYGWITTPSRNGGGRVTYKGHWSFDVDRELARLASGQLAPAQWSAACQSVGVAGVPLDLPAKPENRKWAVVAVVIFIVMLAGYRMFGDDLARMVGIKSDDCGCVDHYPVADGKSDLPGGAASLTYAPGRHDREWFEDANEGSGAHDGAHWNLYEDKPNGGWWRFKLEQRIWEPKIADQATLQSFLSNMDGMYSKMAGRPVTHRATVVAGKQGFAWDFVDTEGLWQRQVHVVGPTNSFILGCIAKRVPADSAFLARCDKVFSTTRFPAS